MYFAFSLVLTFDFFLVYIFMPTTFSITYVRTLRTGSHAPGKDYDLNEFLQKKNIIWDQVILLTPQKDSRFVLKTMCSFDPNKQILNQLLIVA